MRHDYEHIILSLAKKRRIKVRRKFIGASGRCWVDDRIIEIPKKIDTEHKFMTALHEIGHAVAGLQRFSHLDEFYAEQFAIRTARQYGIRSEPYERLASCNVLEHLCRDFVRDGIKVYEVKANVIRMVNKRYDYNVLRKKVVRGLFPYVTEYNRRRLEVRYYKRRKQ